MPQLYHLPVSPACRTIRLLLGEKGIEPALFEERAWERREDFLRLNPAAEIPVLVEDDGLVVPGFWPLVEYLDEKYPDPSLLPTEAADRVEARRVADWFATKFAAEVSEPLIYEKVTKTLSECLLRGRWSGNGLWYAPRSTIFAITSIMFATSWKAEPGSQEMRSALQTWLPPPTSPALTMSATFPGVSMRARRNGMCGLNHGLRSAHCWRIMWRACRRRAHMQIWIFKAHVGD